MCVCVCMILYTNTFSMYICIHVCMYACVYVCMHACMYMHECMCVCTMYVSVCMFACVVSMHVHMYVCICVWIHIWKPEINIGCLIQHWPSYFKLHLFINSFYCVYVWKSEDNLCESVLFFRYMDSRDRIQAIKLGDRHLHSPSHFASLLAHFWRWGLLPNLMFTDSAMLSGHWAPGIFLSLPLQCIPGVFMWESGIWTQVLMPVQQAFYLNISPISPVHF